MEQEVCEAHLGQGLELVHDWNATHPLAYQIRESDIIWNLTEQKLVNYSTTRLAGVPVLLGVAADEGLELGIAAQTLWVSLWGRIAPAQADEFIKQAELYARSQGKTRIAFGTDEFHFVSGIPQHIEMSALSSALKSAQFEGPEYVDFTGSLQSPSVQTYITKARKIVEARGLQLREPLDQNALQIFLAKEFPGRWLREFIFWQSRQGTFNDVGRGLWLELTENSHTIGFARLCVRHRLKPLRAGWTPGSMRLPASDMNSEIWSAQDGCLGPIGVAASERGHGTGRALLGLVLEQLIYHGAHHICIDWTNAVKYYSPLQFDITRRFWSASKNLT